MERQIGQLAVNQNIRHVGALPSDIENNPQVNTVTLRSYNESEEALQKRKEKVNLEGELVPKHVDKSKKQSIDDEKVPVARALMPFPQTLQKNKDDRMFNKFLDMPSQVQLNLPLVDWLRKILKHD